MLLPGPGWLPLQAFLTFCTTATGFDKLFPGLDVRLLTLTLNFHGPLLREWLLLHGFCEYRTLLLPTLKLHYITNI